ncbi:hypothetical protein [Halovulum marinum]|nr:hypothetical protein [Halovulum marinum]
MADHNAPEPLDTSFRAANKVSYADLFAHFRVRAAEIRLRRRKIRKHM